MWKPVEVTTKIFLLINICNLGTRLKHLKIRTPSILQSPEIPFSKINDIYCMNSLKTPDQRDFEEIYMKRVG